MAGNDDRHSKVGTGPQTARTPKQKAAAEARNALRQFDKLKEMIEEALASERFRLRPSDLLELNRLAIENLEDGAGTYRTAPISIGKSKHTPPEAPRVPALVDDLCDFVNENFDAKSALYLASFIMWRLNWIHPFPDGNGRTTRAVSYLVLCARLGYLVPGTKTIPEIIAGNKKPYYDALEDADKHCLSGRTNVTAMEELLHGALAKQLGSALDAAADARSKPPRPTPRLAPSAVLPVPQRDSAWKRQPRWARRLELVGGLLLLLMGGGWQLLTNWDNTRVQQVREWIVDRFDSNPPAEGAASPAGPVTPDGATGAPPDPSP